MTIKFTKFTIQLQLQTNQILYTVSEHLKEKKILKQNLAGNILL